MGIKETEGKGIFIEIFITDIKTLLGGQNFSRGAARETFDGVVLVVDSGGSSMSVPIRFLEKKHISGHIVNRNGIILVVITEIGLDMLVG